MPRAIKTMTFLKFPSLTSAANGHSSGMIDILTDLADIGGRKTEMYPKYTRKVQSNIISFSSWKCA